jgi:hypothetical protein
MFASTSGTLARTSVMERQKICKGWPPKAGTGEIMKFVPHFLEDLDGKNCYDFLFSLPWS